MKKVLLMVTVLVTSSLFSLAIAKNIPESKYFAKCPPKSATLTLADATKMVEGMLAKSHPGYTISDVEVIEEYKGGGFEIEAESATSRISLDFYISLCGEVKGPFQDR